MLIWGQTSRLLGTNNQPRRSFIASQALSPEAQIPVFHKRLRKVYFVSQLLPKLQSSFVGKAIAFLQTTQRNNTILLTKHGFGHVR